MLNELSIVEEFDAIIKDETVDYDLKEFLSDQCQYGQTVFVYYAETTDLYDKYKADCQDWLENLVSETGMKPWDIFEDWDYVPGSEVNKWIVISEMFEEYCITRLDKINKQR